MTAIKALSHRAYITVADSEAQLRVFAAVRRSHSDFVVTLYRDGLYSPDLMISSSLTWLLQDFCSTSIALVVHFSCGLS